MQNFLDAHALIAELVRVRDKLGKPTVSRSEFIRETGISEWQVQKFFDSWNEFVVAAGVEPTDTGRIPDEDLWVAMREAFTSEGTVTTRTRFRKVCRFSDYVFTKRWGTWDRVLLAFRAWLEEREPSSSLLSILPAPRQPIPFQAPQEQPPIEAVAGSWQPSGGRLYGPILNFRGLQHAPINEQGVVFLFGMLAFELGFVVESVGSAFPDCEGKRRVSRRGDMWERVRIEFEYLSRNFRDHGHDPNGADLIICWEHNWDDCPLEVLELRSAIAELEE